MYNHYEKLGKTTINTKFFTFFTRKHISFFFEEKTTTQITILQSVMLFY